MPSVAGIVIRPGPGRGGHRLNAESTAIDDPQVSPGHRQTQLSGRVVHDARVPGDLGGAVGFFGIVGQDRESCRWGHLLCASLDCTLPHFDEDALLRGSTGYSSGVQPK